LKEYVKHGDEKENAATSRTLEFEFANEECILHNTAKGKPGWSHPVLHKKEKFTTKVDRGEKVYQTAAELFQIPLEQVRIWTTYSQFTPWNIVDNSTTPISQTYYLQLFVQRKPPDEEVKVPTDDIVYFLKFFHASLAQPVQ
jgi:hypothetical protein